ncbi:hypothetical protein ETB55_03795 [Salmonella enterica subsp. enterica serovar Omuna]|nr:hypothetical protein [Salmonella enterica subsp. enterica serovar Omuna]
MKHLRLLLYYAKKRVTMHPTYQSDVCLPTTPYLADIAGWRRERAAIRPTVPHAGPICPAIATTPTGAAFDAAARRRPITTGRLR